MEIKNIQTSELIPYANNSRKHSSEQVKQIAKSISEFGFTQPILVDENNTVLAGHGRLLAAQSIGIKQVPVIILPSLTGNQKKAYVIADNKIAENSEWDVDALKLELDFLHQNSFDISVIPFSDKELTKLFDQFADIEITDEADDVDDISLFTIECRKDDFYEIVDSINMIISKFKDAKVIFTNEQV